ncbi:MAG: TolC family protein [Flavobacteriales bacterium]|nr:TolC family protein [Flavobacteriales bacterium]
MRIILTLFIFIPWLSVQAQDTLSLEQYINNLKCCHPIAQNADLLLMERKFNTLAARGGFDPTANADFSRKLFDNQTYYQHVNAGVSGFILPGGIGYQAGYELNSGVYLNPEQRNPTNGLFYAGINVPLLQGMITDVRRTALRQAQVLQLSGEEERRLALNELLFNGYVQYIYWQAYDELEKLYEQQVIFTRERLENIRNAIQAGDRAAIDTADANAMLANWEIGLAETRALKIKYTYMIVADLWNEDGSPRNTETLPIPARINEESLSQKVQIPEEKSPLIRIAELKTEFARLDKRLKAEYLKPKLNLKYNFLYGNPQVNNTLPVMFENYNAGINFSFPLFLRTERGQWRAAEVKWKMAQIDRDFKDIQLQNKIKAAMLELVQNKEQAVQSEKLAKLNFVLSKAEQERFDAGDSNFFNLFLRETNYVNAVQKNIKAFADYKISLLKPRYLHGSLAD